jgi:shikimate kinase
MNALPCRVALVGLMGAGKSRVGCQLAALLSWPFRDADLLIEEREGRSIQDIFQEQGGDAFRDLEAGVLLELSSQPPPLVVSLGGGVVERSENRARLRSSFFVVWLDVDPERAALRLGSGAGRPLLAGGSPVVRLRELHARRSRWYSEVAHLTLDANIPEPVRLGRAIAAALPAH